MSFTDPTKGGNPQSEEDADNEKTVKALKDKYLKDFAANPDRKKIALRQVHPKSHGLVEAQFIVGDDVRADLRYGVFANGPCTYQAMIRFSNGSPAVGKDSKGDVRGIAIKLLGVPGPKLSDDEHDTQDFLAGSHDAFFVKNAKDYVEFTSALSQGGIMGGLRLAAFFLTRPCEAMNFLKPNLMTVDNLLAIRYWSQVPYRLGPNVIKFSLVPRWNLPPQGKGHEDNYLRKRMAEYLQGHDAYFDFMVQLQTDPVKMPIENAAVSWSESLSPFIKVATVRIPAQVFDTDERNTLAENMVFYPWHALPEHEPLGGISRARRVIYQAMSQLRHQLNGVTPSEPTAGK